MNRVKTMDGNLAALDKYLAEQDDIDRRDRMIADMQETFMADDQNLSEQEALTLAHQEYNNMEALASYDEEAEW